MPVETPAGDVVANEMGGFIRPVDPHPGVATGIVLVCTAGMAYAGLKFSAGWDLLGILIFMTVMLLTLGIAIVGRPLGALITDVNVMSLSRFQLVVWTIVILSGYLAYAFARVRAGKADALNIDIDWRLWTLMGITTTSYVGASAILTTKKDKDPDSSVTAKTAVALDEKVDDINANRQGLIYANKSKADAQFTDIFQGDEIGNTAHVDIAKVQMFYFTVIAAVALVGVILHALRTQQLDKFPELPEGFVALLGISHAGYLGSKTVTKTPVAQQ